MAVFSKKRACQQGHGLPSLTKLSQIMGEIKSKRRSLQKQHQQNLISFFPIIVTTLSSMSSSSSCPQRRSPSVGEKHNGTSLRPTMSAELSDHQKGNKATHASHFDPDLVGSHLVPSHPDSDLVRGEATHCASLQQTRSGELPQQNPSLDARTRSTSEGRAMEDEKKHVAGDLVLSVPLRSTVSRLTESGHRKTSIAPPERSNQQPSRVEEMTTPPVAQPELSHQQPSRMKVMTIVHMVPFVSAVQAVKLAVSAILGLCFLYAGKEMAVAITLLGHLMVLLLTQKPTEARSRMTEEGNLTSQKLSTRKSIGRSTFIPVHGRGFHSPFMTNQQKNSRSLSMPGTPISLCEQQYGDENLIMCSESSLAEEFVLVKGGRLHALANNIATLKLQVILLFVLCGLLHGRVMGMGVALLCILLLFEMQKGVSGRENLCLTEGKQVLQANPHLDPLCL